MVHSFTIDSPSEWLVKVKNFLLTLDLNSEDLYNHNFHKYLASTLESYFIHSPSDFLSTISKILTEANEPGKYVLIEILIQTKSIWSVLAQDVSFQPILTELALSSNRLYTKSAAHLSKQLEEYQVKSELSHQPKAELKRELLDSVEEEKDIIGKKTKKLREEPEAEKAEKVMRSRSAAQPSPPPSAGSPPAIISPSEPKPSPPAPSSSPVPDEISALADESIEKDFTESALDDEIFESEIKTEEKTDLPGRTIHTHVHYFSRMNPRNTYPLTVSLSSIAKEIRKEKTRILSGEKESEIRDEFELTEATKQILVEPLLSGCLVQPTFQYVDPDPKNFPRELTFFVTPLVEPGIRGTKLNGSIYIKNESGVVLNKLSLPDLSVVNNRVSQVAATIGAIGGGAMPAFDFLFGINLQTTFAAQLAILLPSLAQSIDMTLVVYALEALLFIGAFGVGFIWYWKKSRAKMAPKQTLQLQLPP